ncbi:ribonuclease H-like domain-containing protein [Tanacetum coccineum]
MVLRTVLSRSGPISLNTARSVNNVQPRTTMNNAGPIKNVINNAYSTARRAFNKITAANNSNFTKKVNTVKGTRVNTARPKAVFSAVKGNKGNVVKASACWVWRPKHKILDHVSRNNGASMSFKRFTYIDAQGRSKSYLTDYEEIDGGFVAFGGNSKGGKINGKCKIRTGKLDFEDIYFVKELKLNLFSVSQMCDKKNSVLFTDTECVVLSPDFKLTDESHVLIKVPRKDKMYSVDLNNVVPQGGLTCLFAKATPDESNLFHRRLGHVNFKTMNKLVRGNLVRDLKVKVIRCDNVTEFKNRVMNQFCEMKGIKKEFSIVRTPQQYGIAERKNRTLIEAARTMLAIQNYQQLSRLKQLILLVIKPTLSFMRPFGCPVTILNTIDHLGKFDGKIDEGFFVGYSTNSKAFRVFNSRTRIVEENLHVQFSENTPNIAGSTKACADAGDEEKKDAEDLGNEGGNPSEEGEKINQKKDASVNSTNNINTVSPTVNAANIEDNAVDENIVYRCVDDLNIHDLEEISRFGDAENDDSGADINNLDTYFQVSPVPTTRIHKNHPLN